MRRILAVLLLALTALLSAPAANAQLVVTDPSNIAVNIEQLVQHLELIRRVEVQIRNQLLMLQNWEFTRLDQILSEMRRVAEVLEASAVYENSDPRQRLERIYSTNRDSIGAGDDLVAIRAVWMQQQREAMIEARAVQNRAYDAMPQTAERIQQYLEQSSISPGPTAAAQAGNELLATLIGQAQTLQALEITASREALEREATRQAEEARTRFRRNELVRDWPTRTRRR